MKYYLQDSRTTVGNFLLFWKQDHKGYTTDISQAHEFTLEEALSHRDTDVPWPVELCQEVARLRVDHQNLPHGYKTQRQQLVRELCKK